MNELQAQYEQQYGPGNYIPPVRTIYWSMRIMAYLGTLVFLVAALGAFLYWQAAGSSGRAGSSGSASSRSRSRTCPRSPAGC